MTKAEIKKFVKEHKTEIIVGGAALIAGVIIGKKVGVRKCKKTDFLSTLEPVSFRNDVYELFSKSREGVSFVIDSERYTTQDIFNAISSMNDPCLGRKCKGLLVFV